MGAIQNSKINEYLQQIQPIATPVETKPTLGANAQDSSLFSDILDSKLTVSKHATSRLQSRNIQLEKEDWDRIAKGLEKAAGKGAKESLFLVDDKDVALVVSVKNRTVITAVDKNHLKENVFTNIDSAVIV